MWAELSCMAEQTTYIVANSLTENLVQNCISPTQVFIFLTEKISNVKHI